MSNSEKFCAPSPPNQSEYFSEWSGENLDHFALSLIHHRRSFGLAYGSGLRSLDKWRPKPAKQRAYFTQWYLENRARIALKRSGKLTTRPYAPQGSQPKARTKEEQRAVNDALHPGRVERRIARAALMAMTPDQRYLKHIETAETKRLREYGTPRIRAFAPRKRKQQETTP
jgi:hypothetical protein